MVDSHGARDRAADDRPRCLDREHRAAVGPGRPRHQRRRPAVDRHGLHPGVRWSAPAGRPDRRLHRPQADLHHRPARLRRRIRARWARRQPGAPVRGASAAGRLRRSAGPVVTGHRDHDLHRAEGAGQGIRCLRCALGRWRRHRSDRRRHPDRVRLLAMVPGRQRARRLADRRPGDPDRAREQGLRRHSLRHPRRGVGHAWLRVTGLRLHRGRQAEESGRPDGLHRAGLDAPPRR